MQNLSEESKRGTVLIFDSLGYLAETFVFIYLGMTIVDFDYGAIRIIFSLGMFIAVALARFFAVFLPLALYSFFSSRMKLTLKEMKIIWYSGLVRGKE
jgi:NhaP-type Na+/H+ or K+/H+ antiporter